MKNLWAKSRHLIVHSGPTNISYALGTCATALLRSMPIYNDPPNFGKNDAYTFVEMTPTNDFHRHRPSMHEEKNTRPRELLRCTQLRKKDDYCSSRKTSVLVIPPRNSASGQAIRAQAGRGRLEKRPAANLRARYIFFWSRSRGPDTVQKTGCAVFFWKIRTPLFAA